MRPADYSEERIVEAGKALQEEGKRVTPFGIRERMGGGRPQRIREIWERYVSGDGEQEARREEAVELPAEFAEQVQGMNTALIADLTAFAKRLYRRADEIAESRTREAMQAARKARESAETDVAEAERVIEDQDAKTEALERQIEALREELSGAKRENRRLEEAKSKEITALTVESTRLGERIKGLEAGVAAGAQTIEAVGKDRDRLDGLLREETARRERLEKTLERERRAKAEEAGKVAALTVDNARLQERASAAETRAGELKTQFEGLQEQFAAAIKQAKPRATRKKTTPARPRESHAE